MKLVDDAKLIWKRWSVWIIAAQGTLAIMWVALPAEWQPVIPEGVKWAMVAVMSAAALTVMPIKQGRKDA